MAFKPSVKTEDLRQTLQEITGLLMEIRRQQLQQEAYGLVTRLALGAVLRGDPAAAQRAAARLREAPESLLGPEIPPDSHLGRAVLEEAARLAVAITPSQV